MYLFLICLFFTACEIETNEGVEVPTELLGRWGLTSTEKAKHNVTVLEFYPTRMVIGGLYFDLQKIEYTKYSRGSAYSQTGTIYVNGPGKPDMFSAYRLSRDGSELYLDGGNILYGPLPSKLKRLDV
jgi:hypothetical protein